MKATIMGLLRDSKITVWGEGYDSKGKCYLETDRKSADYAMREYSNIKITKTACEYAPEIGKWWIALA